MNATDLLPDIVDAYNKGKADGKTEVLNDMLEMLESESAATVGRYELISNLERLKRSK